MCSQIKAQLAPTSPTKRSKAVLNTAAMPNAAVGKSVISSQEASQLKSKREASPVKTIAAAGMTHLDITSHGNQVHVKAGGNLYDSRPGVFHVWSVRVLSPNRQVLIPRHLYLDRPIPSNPGVEMSPEFADTFILEPGDYLVEVVLHSVSPNVPIALQRFENGNADGFDSNQCFGGQKSVHTQ